MHACRYLFVHQCFGLFVSMLGMVGFSLRAEPLLEWPPPRREILLQFSHLRQLGPEPRGVEKGHRIHPEEVGKWRWNSPPNFCSPTRISECILLVMERSPYCVNIGWALSTANSRCTLTQSTPMRNPWAWALEGAPQTLEKKKSEAAVWRWGLGGLFLSQYY